MVDEAERSLHDALSVLSQTVKETRVVLGGGCSEMLMSCAVEEEARKITGKKAIAAEAFSRALRQIPTILADNAGYDSSDLVSRLRAAHYEGKSDAGLGERYAFVVALASVVIPLRRHERGHDRIYAEAGHHRELQAEAAGCAECERSLGDDPPVRPCRYSTICLPLNACCSRVDDILRATPRKREAV